MFKALLDDADGGPITTKSLAKTYVRRQKESEAVGSPKLPLNLWFVNLLQTVSFLNTAQTGGKLSRETMTTFYTEERFPEEILKNKTPRTLFGLVGSALILLFYIVFYTLGRKVRLCTIRRSKYNIHFSTNVSSRSKV